MSKQRKNRFDNIPEVKVEDAESLLDAGKSNTTEPIIDLSSLNTNKSKPIPSSYSSTQGHEEMLQEMIDESGMQDKSKFMRYMIETFHKMTRKK